MNSITTEQLVNAETHTLIIENFCIANGETLEPLKVHVRTWGKLNATADNVVWVVHGLTADADVLQWWPGLVGQEKVFDLNKYFIVCANIPGSCYGSSTPEEIIVKSESDFRCAVQLTPRDVAFLFDKLFGKLGIRKIHILVGASIGGFIALEWAVYRSAIFEHLILVATSYYASPWNLAINETQRMALNANDEGLGLATARAIAMLSYRTSKIYNAKQQGLNSMGLQRAESYQNHQGSKLVKRFSANSYRFLLNLFSAHNVSNGEITTSESLACIYVPTLIIGISSDLLFPPNEQQFMHQSILGSVYKSIVSDYGHDAFLIETDAISKIINEFLLQNS